MTSRHAILLLAAVLPGLTLAQAAPLATATVELREIELTHPAEGVVEAVKQATLAAQVPGRVVEVRADAGDAVKQGQLLTLDGAAAYYDAVMTLAALYRERLPLAVHEVRHESLVSDFDAEMKRVLSFLRLDWDPGVREFADRARRRAITPSDLQVARGLNADGIGQWRRYAAPLAAVRDRLDRWAAEFGYAAS